MESKNVQGKGNQVAATQITREQLDSIIEMKDVILSQLTTVVEKNVWLGAENPLYVGGKTLKIGDIQLQFLCEGEAAFGEGELTFKLLTKDGDYICESHMPLEFELKEAAELCDVINEVNKIDFDEHWDRFIFSVKCLFSIK